MLRLLGSARLTSSADRVTMIASEVTRLRKKWMSASSRRRRTWKDHATDQGARRAHQSGVGGATHPPNEPWVFLSAEESGALPAMRRTEIAQ